MTKAARIYCRNCTAACGLVVETEGNRILSIRGDREHPMTAGYMCIKGSMSGDWHNGEDRLLTALKGRGDRQGPTGTVSALDEMADRLTKIISDHGPRAVALYFGTGAKTNTLGVMALRSWLKAIGSPYLYSSSTLDQSAKWVTAGRMGVFTAGKHVIHETDVSLVIGANPAISHGGLPSKPFPANNPMKWVRDARKRGVRFIAVDPRRTEFARQADIHLQLIPGEDATLLAGMVHVILANGWEDRAFCQRYVTSLDTLRDAVAAFPPDYAARRAGVPEEDLVAAAKLFATSARRSAASGTGPDMAAHSNLAEHLVETLNAICGAYRRAGDPLRNRGSFSPRDSVREGVKPPSRSWQSGPRLWTEDSGMVSGEFPSSRLPNEILAGGVRALVIVGGNPATALGQPEKTLAALEKLDLLVTIDARETETTRLSDYVLPCKLPYERHDATHFFDSFFIETFAQMAFPLVTAPEGILDDWEIFWELARRMDRPLTLAEYKWGAGSTGSAEFALDMEQRPRGEDLMRWLCGQAGLRFEDFVAHPEGILGHAEPLIVGPAVEDDGPRLDVCPADVAGELAAARAEGDESPFRYRLAVRRMLETMNSAFRDAAQTRRRWPRNPAFMNPDDMARDGIVEGMVIEIASAHGRIIGRAHADPHLREGVVSMTHQWGAIDTADDPLGQGGGFTGRLVSLDHDLETINFMPRQTGIPVNIRPTG